MIKPIDIQEKVFTKAVRGYKEEEVNAFLDEITVDLDRLLNELRETKEENSRLVEELERHRATEGRVVETLRYKDLPIVVDQSDGWAYCVLDDSEDAASGWVNADYIAVDPAWYRTEKKTTVYAWDEAAAPKVALLDANTTLPILKDEGDWLVVSLRGAVGWIRR